MMIISVILKSPLTTIAISRKNHLELSQLCKKGQTFDSVLTLVLKKIKEFEENNDGQSKFGIRTPDTLTSRQTSQYSNHQESDSSYE